MIIAAHVAYIANKNHVNTAELVMSDTTSELQDTDTLIRQFAKEFNMPIESYKLNQKTSVITFHCIDVSNSEIDRWDWQVPAFMVKTYFANLAAQKQRWEAGARISELERLTVKHNKKSVGDTDCSVVNVLLAERIAELHADLGGVIGEPLGSSQSAVDALTAQGHEAITGNEEAR